MFAPTDMTNVAPVLSMLVEVVDNVDDREHPGFLEASLGAHPPL